METKKNEEDKTLNVMLIFFSATGNTKKVANTIEKKLKALDIAITSYDITSYENRNKKMSFSDYDAIIFGFPIYSLRAPRVCREWLEQQNGEGKRCSVFFTYGGFAKEPAHYYMKELLEQRHFSLVSTAEFLGAHTFNYSGWKAVEGRPNSSDYKVAEEYILKTLERFRDEKVQTISDFETPQFTSDQLDQAEKYRFSIITQLPTRNGEGCSLCMLCENLCPTNAMNAVKDYVDKDACIACFKCLANCPENVLHTNDIAHTWESKLKMHNTTQTDVDHQVSKYFL